MQPNQPQHPSGPGPQPPYRPPEPAFNPTTPVNTGFGASTAPIQHPDGHYEVVPPLPVSANTGHSGHNAYEFIMAPAAAKKRFSLNSTSFLMRIGFIVGGVVVLLIIAAVVISALAPKGSTPGLTAIAQRQQEIIRLSENAADQADGQDTLNFIANVDLSVTSSQQHVLTYLSGHGTKLKPLVLSADRSSQADTLLDNAASVNNFDAAISQVLVEQLQTYEKLIHTAAGQTSNTQARTLLQNCLDSADKLLTQAESLPSSH